MKKHSVEQVERTGQTEYNVKQSKQSKQHRFRGRFSSFGLSFSLVFMLAGQLEAAAANYTLPISPNKIKHSLYLQGLTKQQQEDGHSPQKKLNTAQRKALFTQGFVIVPGTWNHFDHVYEETRYMDQPIFVTTDSMLHVYHLAFGKMLRDLEREKFVPAIQKMSTLLVADARQQLKKMKGTSLEPHAKTALAYWAVAQKLIDPKAKPPAEVAKLVQAELKRIEASNTARSAVFPDLDKDYSQYIVRGHYTRGEALKRYFRAMMWLGRVNLRVEHAEETRTAALLTSLMMKNTQARTLWSSIYEPTSLLIGKSDDLDFWQYTNALRDVTAGDVKALQDKKTLQKFQKALKKLPPPRINSLLSNAQNNDKSTREKETLGFRVMGQRFILDGAIFQRLVYREVGTRDNPRSLPKGLDLLAAFGNDAALNELARLGDNKYKNYKTQMNLARQQVAKIDEKDWNKTVYSGWLYTLKALATPEARDKRYPAFMHTPAWKRKEMLTFLGSWTELKHDTILYGKQTMAEMGAGGGPPEYPVGYVEPNMQVWKRLKNLTVLTHKVLKSKNVLSKRTESLLDDLKHEIVFVESIAKKQLSNKKLTREEKERLDYYGGWLESIKMASADEGTDFLDDDDMAAIVADVASGDGQALQEGTGFIDEIYVLVPNGNGKVRLTRGGVYSQYEFTVPAAKRMTDEAWRKKLRDGKAPATHPWLKGILVK